MPTFIPGLELSRQCYQAVIGPVLNQTFPILPYAAALIGPGSDVLGFDTEMSTDHGWGPRVRIFLSERDAVVTEQLQETMRHQLPNSFLGYALRDVTGMPLVTVGTLRAFVQQLLAYDLDQPIEAADWLTFPS